MIKPNGLAIEPNGLAIEPSRLKRKTAGREGRARKPITVKELEILRKK